MKRKLSARETAAKLCSLGFETRKTLSDKLYKKGYGGNEIKEAVNAMESSGYIDEKNYARCFVSDSYKIKKRGKIRIKAELKQKGISEDIIDDAILSAEVDEIEIIKSELLKRFNESDDKNKILGFFVRRGFALSDVRRCMGDD